MIAPGEATLAALRAVMEGAPLVLAEGWRDPVRASHSALAGRLRASGVDADVHPVTVIGPGGTEAAARRASVAAVLPLGLCFLPAFVLAGVVPLVAGLLAHVL